MESIKEAFENDDSTPNELNFDGEKITKDLSNNERTLLDSDQLDLGEDVEINDDDLILDDADQAIMEAEASDDFQM